MAAFQLIELFPVFIQILLLKFGGSEVPIDHKFKLYEFCDVKVCNLGVDQAKVKN